MPCDFIHGKDKDGNEYVGFSCRGRTPPPNLGMCLVGGCSGRAEVLCDGPKPEDKTCDLKICRRCAKRVRENTDLCPACWIQHLKSPTRPTSKAP